jgi:hypothetical protein
MHSLKMAKEGAIEVLVYGKKLLLGLFGVEVFGGAARALVDGRTLCFFVHLDVFEHYLLDLRDVLAEVLAQLPLVEGLDDDGILLVLVDFIDEFLVLFKHSLVLLVQFLDLMEFHDIFHLFGLVAIADQEIRVHFRDFKLLYVLELDFDELVFGGSDE